MLLRPLASRPERSVPRPSSPDPTPEVCGSQAPRLARGANARRSLLLCPQAARLDTAALRRALRATSTLERGALLAAAQIRGTAASAYVWHLLEGTTSGTGRPLTSAGVRQGVPLVAALLGGGARACAELGGEDCQPGRLGRRALRVWRELSRHQLNHFAFEQPGGAALVEALDLLAAGTYGVRVAAYQASLRYLLLALVHGGLAGLGRAARALAYAGDLRLVLEAPSPGRTRTGHATEADAAPPTEPAADEGPSALLVLAATWVETKREATSVDLLVDLLIEPQVGPGPAPKSPVAAPWPVPASAATASAAAAIPAATRGPPRRRRMAPTLALPRAAAPPTPAVEASRVDPQVALRTGSPALALHAWPVSAERTAATVPGMGTVGKTQGVDAEARPTPGPRALVEAADGLLQLRETHGAPGGGRAAHRLVRRGAVIP